MNRSTNSLYLTIILCFLLMTSCDPVYEIKLENRTKNRIEVLFSPTLDNLDTENNEITKISLNGRLQINSVTLNPAEMIKIGTIYARYNPELNDIYLEYLEIRMQTDTLRLIGKMAIFSTIQKIKNLDWRLVIRTD